MECVVSREAEGSAAFEETDDFHMVSFRNVVGICFRHAFAETVLKYISGYAACEAVTADCPFFP